MYVFEKLRLNLKKQENVRERSNISKRSEYNSGEQLAFNHSSYAAVSIGRCLWVDCANQTDLFRGRVSRREFSRPQGQQKVQKY